MKLCVVILTFSLALHQVAGTATMWLTLRSYINRQGDGANGNCCDGKAFICQSNGCDHYFQICVDRANGTYSMGECAYGYKQTGYISNRDNVVFGTSIGGTPNPFSFPMERWNGTGTLKVKVWDHDSTTNHDFVDTLVGTFETNPSRTFQTDETDHFVIRLQSRTVLTLELQVVCDQDYYGLGCDVFCLPMDNSTGHFDCDYLTGQPSCHPGWTGPMCDTEVNECESNPCVHGECFDRLASFVCVCDLGYMDRLCRTEINECESDPCLNAGSCIDEVANFRCACAEGWTGETCEENIDDCEQSPCQNSGTCQDLVAGYQCLCILGFGGINCTENIDCSGDQCQCLNGGTCVFGGVEFACECPVGFSGTYCEIEANWCLSNPCQGDTSMCVHQRGGYICVCPDHLTGKHCETPITSCTGQPCFSGATCTPTGSDNFTCTCAEGMSGDLCDHDINECARDSPCGAGNLCINLVGGFACICVPGFTGRLCEVDVNECLVTPCANMGRCVNTIGSFRCDCGPHWTGLNCMEDVDSCKVQPCQNSGTCIDMMGGFICRCAEGWTGLTCNLHTDPCTTMQPCYNNGTCENTNLGKFVCHCEPGFQGEYCEEAVTVTVTQTRTTPVPGVHLVGGGTTPPGVGQVPATTSHSTRETAALFFEKQLSRKETRRVVDLLVRLLADHFEVSPTDIHISYTWSSCYGDNKAPVSVVIFRATRQGGNLSWRSMEEAMNSVEGGDIGTYLGVSLYDGEDCLPSLDSHGAYDSQFQPDVAESTSGGSGYQGKYIAMGAVIAGVCLIALAIIVVARKKKGSSRLFRVTRETSANRPGSTDSSVPMCYDNEIYAEIDDNRQQVTFGAPSSRAV